MSRTPQTSSLSQSKRDDNCLYVLISDNQCDRSDWVIFRTKGCVKKFEDPKKNASFKSIDCEFNAKK